MEDLIKREDAIKAVERLHSLNDEKEIRRALKMNPHSSMTDFEDTLVSVFDAIEDIPSAENKGEWIKHDEERDYCSVCKHIFKTRTLTKQDKWTTYVDDLGYNFCPNCGARMKGAK